MVRQDKVQIIIEFLNEDSKSLAKHVIDAKKLNDEIKKLGTESDKLNKEFEVAQKKGLDVNEIEKKRVLIQEQLNQKLKELLTTNQKLQDVDLSKVVPQQLINTAKELQKAMDFLPRGTEQYARLAENLKKVNDQIAINRKETKGVAQELEKSILTGERFSDMMSVAFGVSAAELAQNFVANIKQIGVELFQRSKELEFFEQKAKNVFGENYKEMIKYAELMSSKVGKSVDETMKDLAQTSNSIKTLEFPTEHVETLTKKVYEISAAWAAYNGGQYSVTQTSETLMKALGGEVDELNEIGIVLTENTLKNELTKKGYDKLTGAAYDQAAALALIQLVSRKTSDAMQAFGGTNDSIAAKQNRINATLKQSYDDLAKGLNSFFSSMISVGAKIVDFFAGPQKTLIQSVNETQAAFNREIAVLQTANITKEARKKLINDINKEYKQYLPSLITEKTTNHELNQIREKGNSLFKEQIFYMANQSKLTEISQKAAAIQRELIELEMKRANIQYIADTDFESEARMKQLLYEIEQKKTAKQEELKVFQKEQKDFMEAAKTAAKSMGIEWDKLGDKWGNKSEKPLDIKIKPEFDKKKMEEERKKAYENELKAAEARHIRAMTLLEKEHIETNMSEIDFQEKYKKIKIEFFAEEDSIFKKYNETKSIEAAKVAKERVELEKNTNKAIIKLRIEDAEKAATAAKTLAENRFLKDTEGGETKEGYKDKELLYKLKLLAIDESLANEKLKILQTAAIREVDQEEKLKNDILKIKKQRRDLEQQQLDELKKQEDKQREDEINKQVEGIEKEAITQDAYWKRRVALGLQAEQEYQLQRLEIKRAALEKEQKLLEAGSEEQKKRALQLGNEIIKVDEDIELQKINNKKRTLELEKVLFSESANMATEALSFAIDIIGKDEKERKKHANTIKDLEIASIWIKSTAEIQGIWKNANENPLNAIIPGWGPVWAGVQTGLAIGRAYAATQRIQASTRAKKDAEYSKGGFTKGLGYEDETGHEVAGIVHADEWVGNPQFVKAYPDFFKRLDEIQKKGSFVTGGFTSPMPNLYAKTEEKTIINVDTSVFEREVKQMYQEMQTWQRDLSVHFNYSSYLDFKNNIETSFKNGEL